jgi:hypothetical protein
MLHRALRLTVPETFSTGGQFVSLEFDRHPTDCSAVLIDPHARTSRRLGAVPRGVGASISLDGKWAVAVAIQDRSVTLFDVTQDTRRSLDPPGSDICLAARFSPQGDRLLITTVAAHHVFRGSDWKWERTWERRKSSPHPPNRLFDRSGTLTLHSDGTDQMELRTFPDWQLLAALPAAAAERPVTRAALAPDADRLATFDGGFFEVWNLRRLREILSILELDWDGPALPPDPSPLPLGIGRPGRSDSDP